MSRLGFEPTISAGERPKTYALDRAATGTGFFCITLQKYKDYCDKRCDALRMDKLVPDLQNTRYLSPSLRRGFILSFV